MNSAHVIRVIYANCIANFDIYILFGQNNLKDEIIKLQYISQRKILYILTHVDPGCVHIKKCTNNIYLFVNVLSMILLDRAELHIYTD